MSIEDMLGFGLTKEERRERDQMRAREAMERFESDPRFSAFFAESAKNKKTARRADASTSSPDADQ